MCICIIYMCIQLYTYLNKFWKHTCTHIYMYVYTHMYTCIYIYMYVHMHALLPNSISPSLCSVVSTWEMGTVTNQLGSRLSKARSTSPEAQQFPPRNADSPRCYVDSYPRAAILCICESRYDIVPTLGIETD